MAAGRPLRTIDRVNWCWADLLYAGCARCGEVRRIGNLLYKGDAETFAARREFWREHSFCQLPRRPQEALTW